jgi:hypothetical protein
MRRRRRRRRTLHFKNKTENQSFSEVRVRKFSMLENMPKRL